MQSTDHPGHTDLAVNLSGAALPSQLPFAARDVAGMPVLLIGSVTGSQVVAEEKSRVTSKGPGNEWISSWFLDK